MKAYYYDNLPGDPRLPHTGSPIPYSHITSLGLLHHSFPTSAAASRTRLENLAAARSYSHQDEITVSPAAMGAVYEDKIKSFFHEHMHEDEEIRYILEGVGYFDVREKDDERWIRMMLEEGDLLVLPAGIYHRFTTNEDNHVKAVRLFKDEPKWTPLNRGEETEQNSCRKEYVRAREQGFVQATA